MTPGSLHLPFLRSQAESARAGRHRRRWILAAVALLATGIASSVLITRAVARSDRKQARATFLSSANAECGGDHDGAPARGRSRRQRPRLHQRRRRRVGMKPSMASSNGRDPSKRWPDSRRSKAAARFRLVPRAGLAAFIARQNAEPALSTRRKGEIRRHPPGVTALLLPGGALLRAPLEPATAAPPGLDYCSVPSLRAVMLQARDSGLNAYFPVLSGHKTVLAIYTPLYHGVGVPTTLAERRSRFRGVFGTTHPASGDPRRGAERAEHDDRPAPSQLRERVLPGGRRSPRTARRRPEPSRTAGSWRPPPPTVASGVAGRPQDARAADRRDSRQPSC